MLIRFAIPPQVDSPLARLDGRWRLLLIVLLLIGVAAVRSLEAALLGLLVAAVMGTLACLPWKWFGARLAMVGGLIALFGLPIPWLGGQSWLEGLAFAGSILARALALFTLGCVLLVTAPVEQTFLAARALRLPGLLVQLGLLSYRYLFVLADELARLRTALRVRGFRNRPNAHSYRTVAAASGTLLVRGFERAERVAAAMRCRGFDGEFRGLQVWQTQFRDVFALFMGLLTVSVLFGLDGWLAYG